MKLTRFEGNPILSPLPGSSWESDCCTNPAAWYEDGKVVMLYRGAPDTDEHPIYFGLAESTDGYHFTRMNPDPVFSPIEGNFDGGCVEDPRLVKFGDTYFMTYATRMFRPGAYYRKTIALNAFNPDLPPETPMAIRENITRSALAATKDFKTWYRFGPITSAAGDNRDVIIFPEKSNGRYVMLHRPVDWVGEDYGCDKPSMWLSYSDDMLTWRDDHLLATPAFDWECGKIGGSTPPIKTDKGWLTLYHGVDDTKTYRVGALMLDLDEPTTILGRSPTPILEPVEDYERNGLVPNVVFPCGNVVIDGTLFVYYGGADTHCAVATCRLDELVEHVLAHPPVE